MAYRNQRQFLFIPGGTHKDYPLAVRRPARCRSLIDAGREISNGVATEIVNGNQAVTVTLADEGDVFAIGRPFGLNRRSAYRSQFSGRLFPINSGQPKLLLSGPRRPLAVAPNLNIFTPFLRATHIAH